MIHEWYDPPKKAAKIEVPKKLQGIREVRKMYWINHDILQVASNISSTLRLHVANIEFRETMHFPGAVREEEVPSAPMTLYKAK
jgi:predicted metallopeptidase